MPQARPKQSNPAADTKGRPLSFSDKTYIMGILNVTPDSFSDGGYFFDKKIAVRHALQMARDSADIIDVGGESTRPGAEAVIVQDELDRVIPVIEELAKKIDKPISIDTRKSEVAKAAVRAGASIINDVSGLRNDPELASVAAKSGAKLIIMHMQGTPADMQKNPTYRNLIKEIKESLKESAEIAIRAGVAKEDIVIDPGIGFGKTVEHNLRILASLDEFKELGYPICIGTSRKSFIGKILDCSDASERLAGTLATCVIAIMKGANILRVHDVKEARQAAAITDAVLNY
ncbi:MAG: dihydropteroate synthase [Candidatus Omnitrophica bacterium]|nr:dihydropteroate synthase [Candidatus Omnitrophota bacterium]